MKSELRRLGFEPVTNIMFIGQQHAAEESPPNQPRVTLTQSTSLLITKSNTKSSGYANPVYCLLSTQHFVHQSPNSNCDQFSYPFTKPSWDEEGEWTVWVGKGRDFQNDVNIILNEPQGARADDKQGKCGTGHTVGPGNIWFLLLCPAIRFIADLIR
ncbi:hypothetical protein Btru_070887 [Bulinus truncatus]|nr:hypothetical protein Btru_070887 [Bulinus truncatus]